jgi:hypothetical protein
MNMLVRRFVICALLCVANAGSGNLYSILGVPRKASVQDIKKAYREMAKEYHPDKNPDLSPELAAAEFREVSEAYEILMDASARRIYDETGHKPATPGSKEHHQQQHQQQFGKGGRRFRAPPQPQPHPNVKQDWRMNHPDRRKEVLDAQSRVLRVRSLEHLRAIAADEAGVLERVLLLAFYSSADTKGCRHRLDTAILYPYPFAGVNRRDGEDGGVLWSDLVTPAEVDLAHKAENPRLAELASYFGLVKARCPTVVFVRKGVRLDSPPAGSASALTTLPAADFERKSAVHTSDEFAGWVWGKLQISVTLQNKAPFPLNWFYVDDAGKSREEKEIEAGAHVRINTFITHVFMFRSAHPAAQAHPRVAARPDLRLRARRPKHVQGTAVNNESSYLAYRARLSDDEQTVDVNVRCIDAHSDCPRWQKEGFCEASKETRFTKAYPGQRRWTHENCPISCANATRCAEQLREVSEKHGARFVKEEL